MQPLATINRALLRLGASPLVVAAMQAGHRLCLDLRAGSEWLAFYTGEFDDGRLAAACRLLDSPGAVAVDAGANIGFWTVPLARAAARVRGRVVAVEPIPSNHARLRTNLKLNDVAEVTDVCAVALSHRAQQLVMTLREDFLVGAATGNAAVLIEDGTDHRFDRVHVDARTLDDLLQDLDVPRLDVVKADVEGHEHHLLQGAMGAFQRWRPVAFFEWNRIYHQRLGLDATTTMERSLHHLNYRCLRRQGPRWIDAAGYTSPKEVDDLVLAPTERANSIRRLLDDCTRSAPSVRP